MRKGATLFIGLLFIVNSFANINYIDIRKISNDPKHLTTFDIIKENQGYYNHWTPEWHYDKSKEELARSLKVAYTTFSSIESKNTDLFLLLGDIAHYLYNLNEASYFEIAVKNFKTAIKSSPQDYRTYWFLGYHYALSNLPKDAINNLLKAQTLLPDHQPSDFWDDYAHITAIANMPSHTIFAMDQVKRITGKPGRIETQLGQSIYDRIVDVDKDSLYTKKDIWTASAGKKVAFTCRSLGMKIQVDSTWDLSITDYNNSQGAFIITPPAINNSKGKKIGYTIALLMKVANDDEKLEDYLSRFVSKYPGKMKISFSDQYENMIAYEIRDKTIYQDIGGGHLYMIGIERNAPKYPGLLLEEPAVLQGKENERTSYYMPSKCKNRFKEKIFYAIMLDTCEDIHEQSFATFKNLFQNQLIIE